MTPGFPPAKQDRIRRAVPKPVDNLSRQERSERMSRIKGKDTGPEMVMRRLVHSMGFRYRLHARDLPGVPDLVLPRLGKIIFVHGCFWHQHPGCGRQPKSRVDFWTKKLFQNRERDLRNQRELRSLGRGILRRNIPSRAGILNAVWQFFWTGLRGSLVVVLSSAIRVPSNDAGELWATPTNWCRSQESYEVEFS
jgi:DNA mismatch endonuclease (patch repair protein)